MENWQCTVCGLVSSGTIQARDTEIRREVCRFCGVPKPPMKGWLFHQKGNFLYHPEFPPAD